MLLRRVTDDVDRVPIADGHRRGRGSAADVIFLVNVPIVIVGVAAIVLLVPDSKNPRPGRLDSFGVLLSIVALVVLVNGVIQGGNSNEWLRWNSLGAILLGVAQRPGGAPVVRVARRPTRRSSMRRSTCWPSRASSRSRWRRSRSGRAGVAKTTIYRRWPNRDELVMDAVGCVKAALPEPPGESVRADLLYMMNDMRDGWFKARFGRLMGRLAADGIDRPDLYREGKARFVAPRRAEQRPDGHAERHHGEHSDDGDRRP